MFELYKKKTNKNGAAGFDGCEDEISLAGKNTGMICRELRNILKPTDNAPFSWKIPIADILQKAGYALVMNMKPDNKDTIQLCELDTILGFSDEDGSTVMFRLRQLLKQDREKDFDVYKFSVPKTTDVILYTVNYLSGTIENGKLTGTWNFPNNSATGDLLLTTQAMSYFTAQIKKIDPVFLNQPLKASK